MPATVILELVGGDPSLVEYQHFGGYLSNLFEKNWSKADHDRGLPLPTDTKGRRSAKVVTADPFFDIERQRVVFRIHLLDSTLLDDALAVIQASKSLKFGSETFDIVDLSWSVTPWANLMAGTGEIGDLLFTFRTPVIQREGDCPLPFPLPKSLFENLSHRWNKFTPPDLNVPVDFSSAGLVTVDLNLRTELVRYMRNRPPYVGVLGRVRYAAFDADRPMRAALESLGRFSRFSGIGSFTKAGLGVTEFDLADRLLPPCRKRR